MRRFCEVVKEARKTKGLTLERVAKAIVSHKGYVSGIENDQVSPPSAPIVVKLAKFLDLDVEELLVLRLVEKRGQRLTVRKIHEVLSKLLDEEAKRLSAISDAQTFKDVEARAPTAATG